MNLKLISQVDTFFRSDSQQSHHIHIHEQKSLTALQQMTFSQFGSRIRFLHTSDLCCSLAKFDFKLHIQIGFCGLSSRWGLQTKLQNESGACLSAGSLIEALQFKKHIRLRMHGAQADLKQSEKSAHRQSQPLCPSLPPPVSPLSSSTLHSSSYRTRR